MPSNRKAGKMHTFQGIKKLNQAVQVSLGETSAYNFSVLKRPKYGPSAMPKGHSLIKYQNQYFCFTSEPPSQGQGSTNQNWTKAAIWRCDQNGKRTAPLEDPLWDSKKDGWSAEDAFDSFLDYTGGDLKEAATPGKPETMAQRHGRMEPKGFKKRQEWVVFCKEVLKDWKSGDMALNRMEMVMGEIQHISYDMGYFDTRGMTDPFDPKYINAVGRAFRKSIGKRERVGRLGKGSGFNPSMGKVTINEITEYLTAVLDFCESEWADLDKQYGIK